MLAADLAAGVFFAAGFFAAGLEVLAVFALVDFGRMGYSYVMAEKAAQIAVRTAAVRPGACATALSEFHQPNAGARFGTYCRTGGSCLPVATVSGAWHNNQ